MQIVLKNQRQLLNILIERKIIVTSVDAYTYVSSFWTSICTQAFKTIIIGEKAGWAHTLLQRAYSIQRIIETVNKTCI